MADGVTAETFTPAAREALKAFPIEPDALELVSLSENVTYRVVDRRDGVAYALRLHRPWYHTLDELISERAWIRALADAGIAVQVPVRTRDGQEYASVTIPATGERRFAGLARWTTGRVLAEVLRETTDSRIAEHHFAQLGALTASLHDQAATWQPPAAFTRHALDANGFMGEPPHWGPFWDHQGAVRRRAPADARHAGAPACSARAARAAALRLQHDPRRHASRQRPGGRRQADRHRLRRRGLGLACLRHRGGPGASAGRPEPGERSSAPTSPATARCGRSRTRS